MALEDRVKALEEEVSILKDQIRNTLLEIQEQVLIHYYPELRARDAAPVDVPLAAGRAPAWQRGQPSLPALQRFSLAEPEASEETERAEGSAAGGQAVAPAPVKAAPGTEGGSGWASVSRLVAWAGESVERIGKERTAKAVEAAAESGYLEPQARDILLRLVALSDAEPAAPRASLKAVGEVLQGLSQALGHPAGSDVEQRFLREVRLG